MAFFIYSKSGNSYTQVSPVKLTGKQGLLAQYLQAHADQETPFAWRIGLEELLTLLDPSLDPEAHELVFDMIPEGLTEVCLYRVVLLRGVSDFDESDMVMSCRILEQGSVQSTAYEFKKQFTLRGGASPRQIVEAFHLTGGVATGTYYWGKPKMDIGAAICPAAGSSEATTS